MGYTNGTGGAMVQYIRIYGGLAVLLAVVALIVVTVAIGVAIIAARRGRRFSTTMLRGVAWVLAAACTTAVYVVTLLPMAAQGSVINLVPLSTFASLADPSATTVVQLVGNFLLLAWVGILMPALVRRPWPAARVALLALVASLGIEVLQYVSQSGRASTVDDVLLNTLGAYAGAVLGATGCTSGLRRSRPCP